MSEATVNDVQSVIGTTISIIGGYPATFDAAGFATKTSAAVKLGLIESTSLPESSYEEEVFNVLETGERIRILTFNNAGDLGFTLADVPEEDGQAIAISHHNGAEARNPVSVKIEQSNGAVRYAAGKVMTYSPVLEGLNRATYTIAIDKTMVYVAPA